MGTASRPDFPDNHNAENRRESRQKNFTFSQNNEIKLKIPRQSSPTQALSQCTMVIRVKSVTRISNSESVPAGNRTQI